jgi:hypothetical protein
MGSLNASMLRGNYNNNTMLLSVIPDPNSGRIVMAADVSIYM